MKSDFVFPVTCEERYVKRHGDCTQAILIANEDWDDLEFDVALDSGAVIHVCSLNDCLGYELEESPGSTRGQVCILGDGGTIPNLGQKSLNFCDSEGNDVRSIFQSAAVLRPLISVGRICDVGHEVLFNKVSAVAVCAWLR